MMNRIGRERPRKRRPVIVKIANASECLKAISGAVAKRAYEIYRYRGGSGGHENEDWQVAEKEILQPLCCGVLESKDGMRISAFCSSCGAKDIDEIDVCVEPHRLILVGKKELGPGFGENEKFYRVLPFAEEIDPASVKVAMAQHGVLLDITIRKLHDEPFTSNKAA